MAGSWWCGQARRPGKAWAARVQRCCISPPPFEGPGRRPMTTRRLRIAIGQRTGPIRLKRRETGEAVKDSDQPTGLRPQGKPGRIELGERQTSLDRGASESKLRPSTGVSGPWSALPPCPCWVSGFDRPRRLWQEVKGIRAPVWLLRGRGWVAPGGVEEPGAQGTARDESIQ